MGANTSQIPLQDKNATAMFAQQIARVLRPGDAILLEGAIGAGKTCFARATIHALLDRQEDVPSPTFTLVQTYDTPKGEVWHCDLYRLTHPDEVFELGLDQAFETAICLIEWPDRLGTDIPSDALRLFFEARQDDHAVTLHMTPIWQDRLRHIDANT